MLRIMKNTQLQFFFQTAKSSENVCIHEKDDSEISPNSEQKTIINNYKGLGNPILLFS